MGNNKKKNNGTSPYFRKCMAVALACDILNRYIQFEHMWHASCIITFGGHKMVSLYCYFTNL